MIPTKMDLKIKKVSHNIQGGETYYDVEAIRTKFPDVRFPPEKIKQVILDLQLKDGIRQEDLQELSDFDKNVVKLWNFRK